MQEDGADAKALIETVVSFGFSHWGVQVYLARAIHSKPLPKPPELRTIPVLPTSYSVHLKTMLHKAMVLIMILFSYASIAKCCLLL